MTGAPACRWLSCLLECLRNFLSLQSRCSLTQLQAYTVCLSGTREKETKLNFIIWQARRSAWRWTRCSRWRAAASTTTWAAASTATPSTSSGTCRTLRRCGLRICCGMHMQAPAHPDASVWGSAHTHHQLTEPSTGDARTPLLGGSTQVLQQPHLLHAHAAVWISPACAHQLMPFIAYYRHH